MKNLTIMPQSSIGDIFQQITIPKLRTACYLYGASTSFDPAYQKFLPFRELNPTEPADQQRILRFLRKWGCRQFATNQEEVSRQALSEWYTACHKMLPPLYGTLSKCTDAQLSSVPDIFDALSQRLASEKNRDGKRVSVRFGPVAAAKFLFLLRPQVFLPWDTPIIKALMYPRTGNGYVSYLGEVRQLLQRLESKASERNSSLAELAGRPGMPNPKLIDEYLWITITKKIDIDHVMQLANSE